MKMARVNALFQKEVADTVVTIEGTYDVSMEGSLLRLTDPRDAEFKRIGINDATIVLIPVPLIIDVPHVKLPCGHIVEHPGLGGQVVTCAHDGSVWRISQNGGETAIEAHGTWRKNAGNTDAGDSVGGSGVEQVVLGSNTSTEGSGSVRLDGDGSGPVGKDRDLLR